MPSRFEKPGEEENGENDIEHPAEGATDTELAMFLIRHIENPCEVEVEPGRTEHIRAFYLREAKRALSRIKNPGARAALELKLKEYEGEE